ncbi:MAG TPA: FHA domain-containing protein [Acidimicrobiales bacterium]|nr:FHA domain-containing protein [Acidimicrobiales bacterium]
MTTTCASCGTASATDDYCDSCGSPLAAASTPAPAAPPPAPAAVSEPCPNCGAVRSADDAFCEACGLDFTTGRIPDSAPAPAPSAAGATTGWTAVIEADRAFFDGNDAGGVLAFPEGLAPRQVALTGDEVVIGRRSEGKGFFPTIDLTAPVADPGVSHRHAVLRRQADGSWALLDEMSTNGTWVNGADQPVPRGTLTALHDGDYVNCGTFTRITVVRDAPAT